VRGSYFPKYANPFEIMVGAILTQNTSWKNASLAIEELRRRGLLSPEALLSTDDSKLARIIRSSGYYNQKADRLKQICRFYKKAEHRNALPEREELLAVRGIGPETADSMLLYAYQVPVFVIDAYTKRMFTRIGVARDGISYEELQKLFMQNLPPDHRLFNEYHALIVRHGKEMCRKKPLCTGCVLNHHNVCDYGKISRR
jgi:endonuclease-3 related protein